MPKNTPPPTCMTCGKPTKWLLANTGGRKFRCIDCDGLASTGPLNLLFSKAGRLKSLERLKRLALTAQADLETLPPGRVRAALIERVLEIQRAIDFDSIPDDRDRRSLADFHS